MKLRDYQEACLQRVRERYRAGKRRLLVALPTGTGKTVVFAQFPSFFRMKKRLLVLAHREELLAQAASKFRAVAPDLKVTIQQAGERAAPDAQVVVASVPTLGRRGSARLARFDPEDFYLIVVDEAHHAVTPIYRRILDHFGMFEPSTRRLLVGFTATPYRSDRQALGAVFEEVAYQRHLEEMIRAGHLCPISGWRVTTDVDIDAVPVRGARGDFVESQLAAAVNTGDRNTLLVRAYRELLPGRRCLVFCADVAHAQEVAHTFTRHGHAAAAIWGGMPRDERPRLLASFAAGEIDILTNCNVLTEGFDEPRVDGIIMARPTRSRLVYTQIVGRGTRLHPDKLELRVVDVVDNTCKHSLAQLSDLFSLPRGFDLKGRRAMEMVEKLERTMERFPWVVPDEIRDPDDLDFAAQRVDLFRFDPPDEIAELTTFSWLGSSNGYTLMLPPGDRLALTQTLLDKWQITLHSSLDSALVGTARDLPSAIRAADRWVIRERPDVVRVVDRHAPWRQAPPTESQLAFLRSRRVPVPPTLTKGDAAWMIGMLKQAEDAGEHQERRTPP